MIAIYILLGICVALGATILIYEILKTKQNPQNTKSTSRGDKSE